jgi:hypothetical protein
MSPRQAGIAVFTSWFLVFVAALGIGILAERFTGSNLIAIGTLFGCSALAIIISLAVTFRSSLDYS